jgi:predicted transcriptional regulator
MAKTIKQIADELGVSKQAVFKKIDNLGCRQQLTKIDNQFTVDEKLENTIKKAFSEKVNTFKNVNQSSTDNQKLTDYLTDTLKVLQQQNELLSRQLEEKDKQISNLQKLIDQSQQLQAIAENKIKLLEQKQTSPEPVNGSSSIESKKGFFARLFGR